MGMPNKKVFCVLLAGWHSEAGLLASVPCCWVSHSTLAINIMLLLSWELCNDLLLTWPVHRVLG